MNTIALVSGGVDSSVALRLLCDAGERPTAVYLKIWLEDELSHLGSCPWEDDLQYVRLVCEQLGVPLEIISLQQEYHERVVAYLIDHIKRGLTPNPDIMCNQYIKFGAAFEHLGATCDRIATGHYAQTRVLPSGDVQLTRAVDAHKDQTYFLAMLAQEQLRRAVFPIGAYRKAAVRELAEHFKLPNAQRKDSQGICFLGKISFVDFVRQHLGVRPGDLVEYETGIKAGRHEGYWFYTVGQRSGLGLSGGPWYVVTKSIEDNVVFISRSYHDLQESLRTDIVVPNPHWNSPIRPVGTRVQVKTRHGAAMHDADMTVAHDGSLRLTLDAADQGIASGQFAVIYQGDVCYGGGEMVQTTGGTGS